MVALYDPTSYPDTKEKFNVTVLEKSQKKFQKLIRKNNKLQNYVETLFTELSENPFIGEKLNVNFNGCRSIHFLKNKYRIIYQILQGKPEIIILEIGHRKDCYSDLARVLGRGK